MPAPDPAANAGLPLNEAPDDRPQRRREWSGWLQSLAVPVLVAAAVVAVVWAKGLPAGWARADSSGPGVAARAPGFTLTALDGQQVSLAGYAGRPVLLTFWASWCQPCREELPEFVAAAHAHPELAVIAVNIREDPGTIRAFAEKYGIDFPLLLDTDGAVYRRYHLTGAPSTYFIGEDGRIRALELGPLSQDELARQLGKLGLE